MSVSSCERCGKVIDSNMRNLCELCIDKEDIEFARIREYIKSNPGATVFQVTTDLEIPIKNIKRYLRENRLEIVARDLKNNEFLSCVKCGASIPSGYYCIKCATSIQNSKINELPIDDKMSNSKPVEKTGVRFSKK